MMEGASAGDRRQTSEGRLVLLAGDGYSSRIVYNALRRAFGVVPAIVEQPVPLGTFLRRRVKRLGLTTVVGQLAFSGLVLPVLRRRASHRIRELVESAGFDESPITNAIRVESVNSDEARRALRDLAPDVVVVNGTRIIGDETLRAVAVPFINMHAGITPMFRGVHGAYWALVEQRPDLVGVTIHYVDRGIDTGDIISQPTLEVTAADSFVTYPYLQLAAGLPRLIEAVRCVLAGRRPPGIRREDLPSVLRTHPTALGYLRHRVTRGVR